MVGGDWDGSDEDVMGDDGSGGDDRRVMVSDVR